MRILLASTSQDDLKFYKEIAALAGMPLLQTSSFALLATEFQQDPNSIMVVELATEQKYKEFEDTITKQIGLFNQILDTNKIFFVAPKELHEVSFLTKSDLFGHFIQRKYDEAVKQRLVCVFKLAASERAFDIAKYYTKEPKVQSLQVTKSSQKLAIVDSLKAYLAKIGFKSRVATGVATAVDELIMNAIFDAPVDEAGKVVHLNTPRSANLDLTGRNIVDVKICFDGDTLGISVLDQHGSIDKKRLIDHIGRSYEDNEFKVKVTKAGAGLGLANVYRNCGGLVFVCEVGLKTEVILLYKKTDSFKEFKEQPRFLSVFTYF
ncbi:MAG: hypothetical protein AB7F43_04015 [Bacteriovoracia bacterium]